MQKKKNILVVSQNLTTNSEFIIFLMKGYEVKAVNSIKEALEELKLHFSNYYLVLIEEVNLAILNCGLPVVLWLDSEYLKLFQKLVESNSSLILDLIYKSEERDHLLKGIDSFFGKD